MASATISDHVTRKTIGLPDDLWEAINDARRREPGRVPSEAEMIRTLIRQALEDRGMQWRKLPKLRRRVAGQHDRPI